MKGQFRFKSLLIILGVFLFSGLLSSSILAKEKFTAAEKASFKENIDQIAHKLISNSIKKDTGIGWANLTKDGKTEESQDFYTGNSGICYFLLKAYAAIRYPEYLDRGKACMAYIQSQLKRDDKGLYLSHDYNGLFEGNAGPGYLFLYAYSLTKDKAYLELAEETSTRIVQVPDVQKGSSPDIISGAAGTGLFLLKMYQVTKNKTYLQGAEKLGDFLIETAETQDGGAKWKLSGNKMEYYFVGFSHGPVGIGYYLHRLSLVSKNPQYREYAQKAMTHIEKIAIHENNYVKWYHEELNRKDKYPSQWCHGAPGMNPFFLDMYADGKDRKYLALASENTLYLLNQGVNIRKNGSVCHGVSGNAAALYQLYKIIPQKAYFDEIRKGLGVLQQTVKKDADGYYWDSQSNKIDYSYMTGVAGIGDFYVFLYSGGKLHMMGGLGYGDDI
jgi:lantibiotic modifying enzyme